jgi:hypothetical protein
MIVRLARAGLAVALLFCIAAPSRSAASPPDGAEALAVPTTVPFQGFLRDEGLPMDGFASITASLYSASNGGLLRWGPETHPSVAVDDGVFQLSLGNTVALPASVFDGSPLWLNLIVNGEALTPRTQLQSAPFAMRAANADLAAAVANSPGVAYEIGNPAVTLTTTEMQDVQVVSITVPGPGFVVVQAQTYVRFQGTADDNRARFQIDPTQGGSGDGSVYLELGRTVNDTGISRYPVHLTRMFPVVSGTYTYRLEGIGLNPLPAQAACFNGVIVAMYFPMAYGSISRDAPDGFAVVETP